MPDTQVLEILVLAMIAGVILFRLYTVLGRRTGHEPPPPSQPGRLPGTETGVLPPPPADVGRAGGHGLLDIQLADRNFDAQSFLSGARSAYELIVTAFQKGDRASLRPLLSNEVFSAFDAAISARGAATGPAFTSLKEARITGASLVGDHAEVTITFTAMFGGAEVVDVWTFARRVNDENPNWTLTATSGDLPE
jgi:predicted lipid-binding transport protein (Tim44 family)